MGRVPDPERDPLRGAWVGMAIGDAIGSVRAGAPATVRAAAMRDLPDGGTARLPRGVFGPWTACALATAEALVMTGAPDVDAVHETLGRWWREGRWSPLGHAFGAEAATHAWLVAVGVVPPPRWPRSGRTPTDVDPGTAHDPAGDDARVPSAAADDPGGRAPAREAAAGAAADDLGGRDALPLALAIGSYLRLDASAAVAFARRVVARRGPEIADATAVLARLAAVTAVGGTPWDDPDGWRGPTPIAGLAPVALAAVRDAPDFQAALAAGLAGPRAVPQVAALTGWFAGARFGLRALPERWRAQVAWGTDLLTMADRLRDGPAVGPQPVMHPWRTWSRSAGPPGGGSGPMFPG